MENTGLINKYIVLKADGSLPADGAEYFVLRLDDKQKSKAHRSACIKAVLTYAEEIKDHLPELARDLRMKYLPETFGDSILPNTGR